MARTAARRSRRGGRVATGVSIVCAAAGLGLVGTALADAREAGSLAEPPLTPSDVAQAPYVPPGRSQGDPAPAREQAPSLPPPTQSSAATELSDRPAQDPGEASPEAGRAAKSDVLPEDALAPEGELPGVVRLPAPPEPTPQRAPDPGQVVAEPVRLRIPEIGVDTDLLHLGLNQDGTLAVPPRTGVDNLKASWYDGSPRAGEVGPTVLAGHIDSQQGPSVFYRLGELDPDDEVFVDRADGTTATFVVDTSERYPKDDFPTLRVYGNTSTPQIRLITCGGVFDRSTGHYRDNTVVYGSLVDG